MSTPRRSSRIAAKSSDDPPSQSQTGRQPRKNRTQPRQSQLSIDQRDRRKAVEEFFSSSPLTLELLEGGKRKGSTRYPQKFDMHLHHDLILHHVLRVPSIRSDLLAIAEDALNSFKNLPSLNEQFPSKERRGGAYRKVTTTDIWFESEVQGVYQATTAKFCQVVGATLAFQLPKWSTDGLVWDTIGAPQPLNDSPDESNDVKPRSYATADGFLEISFAGEHAGNPVSAEPFKVVAVWDFKNPRVADESTMEAILNYSECLTRERFPWQGCSDGVNCLSKHRTRRCRMGFDAEDPVCSSIKQARETIRVRRACNPHPELPDLNDFLKTPRYILQQVWAEAVKYDATFIVINSGNLELICIRDRVHQALYVSDIIHVPERSYFQLQTGLFIAAIRDTAARASLIAEKKPLPSTWTYRDRPTEEMLAKLLKEALRSRAFLSISAADDDLPIPANLLYRRFGSGLAARLCEENLLRIRVKEVKGVNQVFRGCLEIPWVPCGGISVLVTITWGDLTARKLRNEYAVQSKLCEKVDGILKPIGLFEKQKQEENGEETLKYGILVMEDAGESVAELLQKNGVVHLLSRQQLNEYRRILGEVHTSEYTHRNLTLEALWVKGSYGTAAVAIGRFGDAAHRSIDLLTHSLEAEKDVKKLLELVPHPLKRVADTLEEVTDDSDDEERARSASQPLPERPSRRKYRKQI